MDAIVVTDNTRLASQLTEALAGIGVSSSTHAMGTELHFRDDSESIILFDAVHHPTSVIANMQKLSAATKAVLVVIGAEDSPEQVLNFVRAGAHDYVDVRGDLKADLAALLARIAAKRRTAAPKGRLIAITSASGGCGASTTAASVATVLARQAGSCCLIDLHLCGGDLAALLQLDPRYTLFELAGKSSALDTAMFRQSLIRHDSGVSLLASPEPFRDYQRIQVESIGRIVSMALSEFPYVVVDLEDLFHQEQLLTLKGTDELVLIFRLDFASLVRLRKCLDQLKKLKVGDEQLRIVAGRTGQPRELAVANAEKAIGRTVMACLPDDPATALTSVNLGVPIVAESPDSRLGKALGELSLSLSGKKDDPADRHSMFPRKALKVATTILGIA